MAEYKALTSTLFSIVGSSLLLVAILYFPQMHRLKDNPEPTPPHN